VGKEASGSNLDREFHDVKSCDTPSAKICVNRLVLKPRVRNLGICSYLYHVDSIWPWLKC
jgi:hypothetical protein